MLTPSTYLRAGVPLAAEAVTFLFITSRLFWSPPVRYVPGVLSPKSLVPKVCFADPKGSVTSSQGIRGYVSVRGTLEVTYSLIKRIMF